MKSMTIYGVDKQLADLIKARAEEEGLSINKTLKKILETALGVKPQPPRRHLADFEEFCGLWSEADLHAFETATSDTRELDIEE